MDNKSRNLPFIALLSASFISATGEILASLAIPWFVLQTTGSAAQTGITAFVSVVPIVIATFFGGTIIDRVGYKRVSIVADLASGVMVALIPLLHITLGLPFWLLLVLVFFSNLLDAPGRTARAALLPDLAEKAGLTLERATAWQDGTSRATYMVGAPLAGILIAALGAINVLWLDAISFLISALVIGIFIPRALAGLEGEESKPYFQELRAGLQFVRRDTVILTLIIIVMMTNMLDAGFSAVMLPVYAQQQFGSDNGSIQLGLMVGVSGGAAFIGTLLMGAFGNRFHRGLLLTLGFAIITLRFFLFAFFPPFGILLIVLGIVSLAIGPLNPVISTVLYERIPTEMRARVLGTVTAGVWVAMPLGGLIAGFMLEGLSLSLSFVIFGAAYVSVVVLLAVSPATRQMGKSQPATAATESS